LPRGHAAIAFVDVGVGFADRAAVLVGNIIIIIQKDGLAMGAMSSSILLETFLQYIETIHKTIHKKYIETII